MSTDRLRRYTGWAAWVAGVLETLGLVFLILFFALELPQGDASTLRFGYLSDVTPILAAPVNVIVMLMIFLLQRKHAPVLSILAILLGSAGIYLTAWTNIRFVSHKISLEQQTQLFYLSLAFLGSWHILVNALARHNGSLPSRLTLFGIFVGIGQLVMYIGSFLVGGYDEIFQSGFTAIMEKIPFLISLVIGIPLAFLGAPVWLVWLGQALLRTQNTTPALSNPAATMTIINGLKIIGIAVRTTNKDGQSAQDIGKLWEQFYATGLLETIPNKVSNDIYAIYTDYQSDYRDEYTTILGAQVNSLDRIPSGMIGREFPAETFEVFPAKGGMPKAVMDTWSDIWQRDQELQRKYTYDFEHYTERSQAGENSEVSIFIATHR